MKEHGIRHLPVNKIKEVEQELKFNLNDAVESYMSCPVLTVDENAPIEVVTKRMIDLKISTFVVSGPNRYIKGIITTEDLLKYLLELINTSGFNKIMPISSLCREYL